MAFFLNRRRIASSSALVLLKVWLLRLELLKLNVLYQMRIESSFWFCPNTRVKQKFLSLLIFNKINFIYLKTHLIWGYNLFEFQYFYCISNNTHAIKILIRIVKGDKELEQLKGMDWFVGGIKPAGGGPIRVVISEQRGSPLLSGTLLQGWSAPYTTKFWLLFSSRLLAASFLSFLSRAAEEWSHLCKCNVSCYSEGY